MPDLISFLKNNPADEAVAGIIKRAPASLTDPLWVIIPTFDTHTMVGPCTWQPRGSGLPQLDATCLVVFDDSNRPWVPAWEGATTFPEFPEIPAQLKVVQTYTTSNVTTDRALNANATSLDEIADVLATLIEDLKTAGLIDP